MAVPILTPGDDASLAVTLFMAGVALNVTGTTIEAAIQDGLGCQMIAATTQSSSTSGASWSTGLVVVEFTAAQTAGLQRGDAFLEIQQTLGTGAKRTWPLIPLEIQAGVIA